MQSKLYDLDKRGVRAFVKQNNDTGKYGIECWRKKTKKELEEDFVKNNISIDSNYKMVREGSTQSYFTRSEALEESNEVINFIKRLNLNNGKNKRK